MSEEYNPEVQPNEDNGDNLPESSELSLDIEASEPFIKMMAEIDEYMEGEIEKAKTPEAKMGVIAMLKQKAAVLGEWINSAEDNKIIEEAGYDYLAFILQIFSGYGSVFAALYVAISIPADIVSPQNPLVILPFLPAGPLGLIGSKKLLARYLKRKIREKQAELEREEAVNQYGNQYGKDMHDGTL